MNPDIVQLIALRLAIGDLCRYRLVCQQFNRLLSTDGFWSARFRRDYGTGWDIKVDYRVRYRQVFHAVLDLTCGHENIAYAMLHNLERLFYMLLQQASTSYNTVMTILDLSICYVDICGMPHLLQQPNLDIIDIGLQYIGKHIDIREWLHMRSKYAARRVCAHLDIPYRGSNDVAMVIANDDVVAFKELSCDIYNIYNFVSIYRPPRITSMIPVFTPALYRTYLTERINQNCYLDDSACLYLLPLLVQPDYVQILDEVCMNMRLPHLMDRTARLLTCLYVYDTRIIGTTTLLVFLRQTMATKRSQNDVTLRLYKALLPRIGDCSAVAARTRELLYMNYKLEDISNGAAVYYEFNRYHHMRRTVKPPAFNLMILASGQYDTDSPYLSMYRDKIVVHKHHVVEITRDLHIYRPGTMIDRGNWSRQFCLLGPANTDEDKAYVRAYLPQYMIFKG